MSIFTLILLVIIGYWLVRSLKSIFKDAFGGSTDKQPHPNINSTQSNPSHDPEDQSVAKGEGEYVDFEEV